MRKLLAGVGLALPFVTGCGLLPINWHPDAVGGTMQFIAVEDAKSTVAAARVAFNCRDSITGTVYRQLGSLVDVDSGYGKDPATGTYWSSGKCQISDARSSDLYYWVVRRHF
jgi:hypothetical protein